MSKIIVRRQEYANNGTHANASFTTSVDFYN